MFKNRIALKLTLGFLSIAIIAMLATGIFFVEMFRQYTYSTKQNNMINRARDIASVTKGYLDKKTASGEYENLISVLDTFTDARIWITDNNGNVVIMSGLRRRNPNNMRMPVVASSILKDVLMGSESKGEAFSNFYKESMLTVGVPVYDDNKTVIGAVILHSPVMDITKSLNRVYTFLLIGIIIALIISGVVGALYSTIFTRPLRAMNLSALEMADGNYDVRTNVKQSDEIGQLSSSLDLLAERLSSNIDALFQERNKLKDIISSIIEGLLAFDTDMKLINHNESVIKLFGYNNSESFEESVTEDLDKMGVLEFFKDPLLKGVSLNKMCDFNEKKLKFHLSPVKSSTGDIIGVVALIADISESERLEQIRRDFVANVSHEFRTPLTLIRGSVEAIIDGAVSDIEGIKKYNHRILSETKTLERLVKDLLELSQLQSGKLSLISEEVDLNEIAFDSVKGMQAVADSKYINISFTPCRNIKPFKGDYDRLRQLFVIFIDNSIKHSPENSRIEISIYTDEFIHIIIKDNGAGIPKEDLPYIFDRFYKVDKSRRNGTLGTGLGLSIAKHIVELHHGKIFVNSEIGKGTKVDITL